MTLYYIVFDVSFDEKNYAKTSGLNWNEKSKKVISDNFRVRQLTRLFKISFIHYDNIVDFDSELIKKFKSNYIVDLKERVKYLYECLGCEITLENKEINKVIEEDALKNVCENIIVK
jgi:hypothetical protein